MRNFPTVLCMCRLNLTPAHDGPSAERTKENRALGVVAGAGFDFRATDRMSLFGAFEATLMSGHTRTAAAKAGLKVAF